ncbi:MAG: TRAP transporter small permease [Alphaproteobacteria bacterium]|nr:TRAP transporter small permease [Alphaproteobacteria bacterium]
MAEHGGGVIEPLGSADRWLARLENLLNLIAATAIFFLMFVGVAQILGRTLLGLAIHGYIDWIEQASAIFAFLGIAYCQRLGGHIRMELLLQNVGRRWLWLLEALGIALALFIVGLLVSSSFENFQRAFQLGDSTMDIKLPTWPAKLMVPVALSVLWLRLWLQLYGYVRLILAPAARPLGVPVILDAAAQAKAEIEEALSHVRKER